MLLPLSIQVPVPFFVRLVRLTNPALVMVVASATVAAWLKVTVLVEALMALMVVPPVMPVPEIILPTVKPSTEERTSEVLAVLAEALEVVPVAELLTIAPAISPMPAVDP